MERFIKICKMNQMELKGHLTDELTRYGYEYICEDGFLYAKGNISILLTAHLDTVHKVTCRNVSIAKSKDMTILSSIDGIGGDDRCGIYMILQILERGLRPSILFCEDEEIGGIGSKKFCKSKYIKDLEEMCYLIELDRANANDAVFYDCCNDLFTDYILKETGYKESIGSFSDISHLSPACGIASVNLSCGYYNAHKTNEYVVFEEMLNTINVVEKLLKADQQIQYEYTEKECDDLDYGWGHYNSIRCEGVEVYYYDNGDEKIGVAFGDTEADAMYQFFIDNPNVCFNDILDYILF